MSILLLIICESAVAELFDLTPEGIIEMLNLRKPKTLPTGTEIAGNPAILLEVFPVPDQDAQQVLAELRKISATLPGTMQPARIELRDQPFEKSPSMKIIRKK